MKSENFYAIHHTFSQSVVDALKKIVAEGYQLRITYLLTQGKLSNLEFKNLKKPYNKAGWKWTSIHADKTALENLKLLLFGHLFLSLANEPVELEVDPYHLPYVIKQEIKSTQ